MSRSSPRAAEPPLTLAIDTSGRVASLALERPDGARSLVRLDPTGRRNAKTLIPEAVALCEAAGATLAEVGLVCVATGPGSFTGLRVGVTFAKTLAFAAGAIGNRCDVVGVPTHAAVRRLVRGDAAPGSVLHVVTDGLRGGLYVTRFVAGPRGELPAAGPVELVPAERFEPDGVVICGDESLRARLPADRLAPAAEAEVHAGNLLYVGRKRWRAGATTDPFALVPLYVRRSSAEETADSREEAAGGMRPA